MNDYSIVIPAYNAESIISETIKSAWTLNPFEVIVVDDGSTDSTGDVAASLDCRVIRTENQGAARARRVGLALVSTPLVTLLDADDRLIGNGTAESLRLAKQLLQSDEDFACIVGATIIGNKAMPIWSDGVTTRNLLNRGRPPGPPAAFIWHSSNLSTALNSGPLPLAPAYAEDYELALRGTRNLRVVTHSIPSCIYSTAGGKSARNAHASISASEQIRRHYAKQWSIPIRHRSSTEIDLLAKIRTTLSKTGTSGNRLRILWHCLEAVSQDPINLTKMIIHRVTR